MTFYKLKTLCAILFVWAIASSCNKNDEEAKPKGGVQFGFNEISIGSGSPDARTQELTPYAINIAMVDERGIIAVDNELLPLYNFNGAYITDALTLEADNYTITKFNVVDANNNVIYSAPWQYSAMADRVNNPLPILISVEAGKTDIQSIEVLRIGGASAEDFGYTSFSFNVVVEEAVDIVVKTYDEVQQKMVDTDAVLNLIAGGDTVQTINLIPPFTKLSIPDEYDEFVFLIEKEGYYIYRDTLSRDSLEQHFEAAPLTVLLQEITYPEEALTFTVNFSEGDDLRLGFSMSTRHETVSLRIDWGDGFQPEIVNDLFSYDGPSHQYVDPGVYTVRVTGDIASITMLSLGSKPLTEINLTHLPSLNWLSCNETLLQTLDISKNKHIRDLFISHNQFSSEAVNKILADLLAHARARQLDLLWSGFVQMVDAPPPTGQGLIDLQELQDNTDWHISFAY